MKPAPAQQQAQKRAPEALSHTDYEEPHEHDEEPKLPEARPHVGEGIALIIDDVGNSRAAFDRVLALPFDVAISILPGSESAPLYSNRAKQGGRIVMLHLPMEPANPKYRKRMTDWFLRDGMDEARMRELMQKALAQVPDAVGINNHMGSLLTTREAPMQWVMQFCRERDLFFVDSRTSGSSVATTKALESGISWGSRRIFLDHDPEPEALKKAWSDAVRCRERHGSCIVIGHPHAATLDFLEHGISKQERALIVPLTGLLYPASKNRTP